MTILTRQQALNIALAYAKNEWCLDDETLIEELLDAIPGFPDAASVQAEVDRIGEHYGLTRPATWGV